MPTSPWSPELVLGLIVIALLLVHLWQDRRMSAGPPKLARDVMRTLGLILMMAASTFPVPDAASDILRLMGCLLLVVALFRR